MAGPIVNFVENLRQNRPVRNAIRGAFGLEPIYGQIDSMQEMSARDRELGGNVLDDRETRRSPGSRCPGGVCPVPGSPAESTKTTAMPTGFATEEQPYAGMGIMQAMTTAPSDALKQNQMAAGRAANENAVVPLPPVDAGGDKEGVAAVLASMPNSAAGQQTPQMTPMEMEMRRIEGLELQAQRYYDQSLREVDRDRRMGFFAAAQDLGKRAEYGRNRLMQQEVIEEARRYRLTPQQRSEMVQEQKDALREVAEYTIEKQFEMQQEQAAAEREAAGRTAQIADEFAPLQDRTLPVQVFAKQFADARRSDNVANKVANPEVGVEETYQNYYLAGMGKRIQQGMEDYLGGGDVLDDSAPAFGDADHPGLDEFKMHYRQMLNMNPESYDLVRTQVQSVVVPAVMGAARSERVDPREVYPLIEQIVDSIVGVKPENTSVISQMYDTFMGE